VRVSEPVQDYIARIAARTRVHESIALGASPRGAIALMRAARARASLLGRAYALPDDVQALAEPVLLHRLVLRPEASLHGGSAARLLSDLIRALPVPSVR